MQHISRFIEENYKHFNAASLVDAAKAYKQHLADGKKMMITLCWSNEHCRVGHIVGQNDTRG